MNATSECFFKAPLKSGVKFWGLENTNYFFVKNGIFEISDMVLSYKRLRDWMLVFYATYRDCRAPNNKNEAFRKCFLVPIAFQIDFRMYNKKLIFEFQKSIFEISGAIFGLLRWPNSRKYLSRATSEVPKKFLRP